MRWHLGIVLFAAADAIVAQQPVWTSTSCPLPAGANGYPVVARSPEVDSLTLRRIARAAASSWPGDTNKIDRPQPAAIAEAYRTMPPPVVHRRFSWKPAPADTATFLLRYRRIGEPEIITEPDAPKFARDVSAALRNEIIRARLGFAQHDTLPLTIDSPDEWVDVTLRFGYEPEPGDGVARYAMMEKPITPPAHANGPTYPEALRHRNESGTATVDFLVLADGTVDKASIVVVSSSHAEFGFAVTDFLRRPMRFGPATVDCAPVASRARQPFNFFIHRGSRPPAGARIRP